MQTIITTSHTGEQLKHYCADKLLDAMVKDIGDVVTTYETTQEELAELIKITSRPAPIRFVYHHQTR